MIVYKWFSKISLLFFLLFLTFLFSNASIIFAGQKDSISVPRTIYSDKDVLVERLNKGKSLFRHYCAVCHGEKGGGNGVNAVNLTPRPADFTDKEYMDRRSDEKLFKVISKGGRGAALSKYMPPWGKTLTKEEILSLLVYVRSFSKPTLASYIAYTRDYIRKIKDSNCKLCHVGEKKRRVIAPDLGYERVKLNKNWLFTFLKGPMKIRPVGYMPLTKSRMPNFNFSDEDAEAIAEYLTSREESISEEMMIKEIGGALVINQADVKKGKKLFKRNGCKGCHRINDKGGIVGPNLSNSAHRLRPLWIFKWLQDPPSIRPDSPMPKFGFSDEEIRALVAYIMNLREKTTFPMISPKTKTRRKDIDKLRKRGKELIKEKNCLGCHYIHSTKKEEISDDI
ncbi:MAG: c-type cytochrome [Nitrospirota bacterium]